MELLPELLTAQEVNIPSDVMSPLNLRYTRVQVAKANNIQLILIGVFPNLVSRPTFVDQVTLFFHCRVN